MAGVLLLTLLVVLGAPLFAIIASSALIGFYQQEIENRRELAYPPFTRLLRLEIRDQDPKSAERKAQSYKTALEAWIKKEGYSSTRLVGPTPAYFSRIRGEWRWQILVKGPNPLGLVKDHPPSPEWIVEVDPPVIL